jgi:hypothetical protein
VETAAFTVAKISSFLSFLSVKFYFNVFLGNPNLTLFYFFTEILPLVEFYVEEDISAAEALQLIKTEPLKANNDLKNGGDYQLYENDRQSTDPFSSYFYSHQVKLIF